MPLYNSADYIKKAIDSVLKQSLKNIEVLLVNDGSMDSRGRIADEYANAEPRVQ
ncbi:glycosyltransferase [Paenibacillus sp. FSL H7-0331]|uniref:glycosyltransferase n=1 Tax=Paenibacillus sp. FSL H7-0331 TaxID=1920421 RepID=UPI0015C35A43